MFSPALGRAVRSTTSIPISPPAVCALARPAVAVGSLHPQSFTRPNHQRRLSSSRASIPPNGSSRSQPTSKINASKVPASKEPAKKTTARNTRKKAAQTLNIPQVPPTEHLHTLGVKFSSFFSLHRPISTTDTYPFPPKPSRDFDSIFQTRDLYSQEAVMGNIEMMAGGLQNIETAMRNHEQKSGSQDGDKPEAVAQVVTPEQLLTSQVGRLMAGYIPFQPPPVPVAHDQVAESETSLIQPVETLPTVPVQKRAWSTSVVVTESTDASGQRTYSATTAPMVEVDVAVPENSQEADEFEVHQPFLERMNRRQNTRGRPDMLAISVKRQRKLKMKKHKYKKLMKRTRLLRRKLDRL